MPVNAPTIRLPTRVRPLASPRTCPRDAVGTVPVARGPQPTALRSESPVILCLVGVCIAAGWALRIWRLGDPSLWYDEGVSWYLANQPIGTLLATLAASDFNPPLFPLLLHGWLPLAGESEFALRFPAAVFSTLIVPLCWTVARRLRASRRGALFAAALAALSVFLTDFAQEARAYTAVTFFCLLSFYTLLRALQSEAGAQRWWNIGFVVATVAALDAHYAAALLIPAQALVVLVRKPSKRQAQVIGLCMLSAALWALWLPGLLQQVRTMTSNPDFSIGGISPWLAPERGLAAIIANPGAFPDQPQLLWGAAAILAIVAVLTICFDQRRCAALGFLLVFVALPLAEAALITKQYPKFIDRYLLLVAPFAYLLLALSLDGLAPDLRNRKRWISVFGRTLSTAAMCGFVAANGVHAVQHLAIGSTEIKDGDVRAALAEIRAQEEPGDAIVLAQDTGPVFRYYYDGSLGGEGVGWFAATSEFQRGDDLPTLAHVLNAAAAGHKRLWLLLWHPEYADPTGYLRNTLAAHATGVPVAVQPANLTLRLFSLPANVSFSPQASPLHPMHVQFGPNVTFLGDGLEQWDMPSDVPFVFHVWFRTNAPLSQDYRAVLRLERDGHVYAQATSRPADYAYPAMDWRPGIDIPGQLTLAAGPTVPPADYHVTLSFYDPSAKQDLSAVDLVAGPVGTQVDLGTVRVLPPSRPPQVLPQVDVAVHSAVDAGLQLVGISNLSPQLTQGDSPIVDVTWQRGSAPSADWQFRLVLASPISPIALSDWVNPADGLATSQWPANDVFTDRVQVQAPPTTPVGSGMLEVEAQNASGLDVTVPVEPISVVGRPRQMQPPVEIPIKADDVYGGVALLAGLAIDQTHAQPGGKVLVTLFWQCLHPILDNYTVFVHLISSARAVVAQHDGEPDSGAEPTTSWLVGQWVTDMHTIPLPTSLPAGVYRLELGLYRKVGQTFERLKLPDGTDAAYPATVVVGGP